DEHEVDTVAVNTFGRGPALLAGSRFDSELMGLDLPGAGGRQAFEERPAERENRPHAGAVADIRFDGFEPAGHAAVQRVVVERLIMRLVRLPLNRPARFDRVDRVPAPAIA